MFTILLELKADRKGRSLGRRVSRTSLVPRPSEGPRLAEGRTERALKREREGLLPQLERN